MTRLNIAAITAALIGLTQSAFAQTIERFEEIADDLYYVGNATHNTVFLVTDEGIILADPVNYGFSTELRAEIESRFDVPVRYVLYSHHHADHASGGAVWADTAQFVGHENMLRYLALPPADTPIPPEVVDWDMDGDGLLEGHEAIDWRGFNTSTRGEFFLAGFSHRLFDFYDYDGDGALSGAEITRGPLNEVRAPNITYRDELTITLGGKTAKLVYTGPHTHSDDMSVIIFPEESVGYMADFISIVRPPRWIRGVRPIETWLAAIRLVEAQDFTIAAPGHGAVGDAEYITLFREYLEQLRDEIRAGIEAGETVEQLQARIQMDEYSDWISYDAFLPQNIEDMYNLLTNQ
ncbi:MAG: MBL fold metallo-hydrolase [Gammaproteobacteria bacterium]|nr:MBL fold metallo-hydrolase [Gammaproteobacteria bacterium]MDH3507682.1 MBL fold metallo-hydrolase [Gammaproteobacteria bacterium]